MPETVAPKRVNTPGQVLFATLIGTTIQVFVFYIYATAAALVRPRLSPPLLPNARSRLPDARLAADVCRRLRPTAHRVAAIRALRRSARPQHKARDHPDDDGLVDRDYQGAADLSDNRHSGARAAG